MTKEIDDNPEATKKKEPPIQFSLATAIALMFLASLWVAVNVFLSGALLRLANLTFSYVALPACVLWMIKNKFESSKDVLVVFIMYLLFVSIILVMLNSIVRS